MVTSEKLSTPGVRSRNTNLGVCVRIRIAFHRDNALIGHSRFVDELFERTEVSLNRRGWYVFCFGYRKAGQDVAGRDPGSVGSEVSVRGILFKEIASRQGVLAVEDVIKVAQP